MVDHPLVAPCDIQEVVKELTRQELVYIITGQKEKISRRFAEVKIVLAFHP
jgi:hypothetical protein